MSYTSIIKNVRKSQQQKQIITADGSNNNNAGINVDESMTNSINHMMNNSYTYNYNPRYRVTRLPNPPSFLQHGSLQFVIMDAPTDDNLRTYIKVNFKKNFLLTSIMTPLRVYFRNCIKSRFDAW